MGGGNESWIENKWRA